VMLLLHTGRPAAASLAIKALHFYGRCKNKGNTGERWGAESNENEKD
jgi:hypothetical protein